MGKGLGLTKISKGTYCVFAGGTGILVFIDMIARLALGLMSAVPVNERLHQDFKLELYYSVRNKSEAIALELLTCLVDYCAANNLDNFKLTMRFSDQKTGHWDRAFLAYQLAGKDF